MKFKKCIVAYLWSVNLWAGAGLGQGTTEGMTVGLTLGVQGCQAGGHVAKAATQLLGGRLYPHNTGVDTCRQAGQSWHL